VEEGVFPATLPAGVFSTGGGAGESDYFFSQGTSMAAPHVTGVVSLLLAADPAMTFDEVRSALVDSARPMEGWKCEERVDVTDCGAGHLDAAAALGAAPSGAWAGAPTVEVEVYECLDQTCGEIDATSEPVATAEIGRAHV